MARRLFPFNRFIGLDTVTSPTNMSERFFVDLDGAYVDFRGQIVRGPGVDNTGQGTTKIYNIAHFGSEYIVEYEYDGTDVDIRSPNNVIFNGAFTASTADITPISIVNFDQKQFSFMEGHVPKYWDGMASVRIAQIIKNYLH